MKVKFVIRINLLLLLAILSFAGCKSYELFYIDVLEPGEIFLPAHVNKILIAHNMHPDSSNLPGTTFKVYGETLSDTVYRDSLLANIAIRTFSNMLLQIGGKESECVDSLNMDFPDKPDSYNVSHVGEMKEMCIAKNADLFVMLTSLEYEVDFDIYSGNFGSTFGLFMVPVSSRWLLVDPFNSRLIDHKKIVDTLYLEVEKPFNRDADDNYKTGLKVLFEAIEAIGIDYGSYVSPHFAETERVIFSKGNKHIKAGYLHAKQNNWSEAAINWRRALAANEAKVQAKACFNLALANEMEGLLESALEWATESYQFFPDTLNGTYIRILEERISKQEDIILQIEGK